MLKQLKFYRHKPSLLMILIAGLVFISLACSLGSLDSSKTIRINKTLPTLTPTGAALAQAAAPVQAAANQPAAALIDSQQAVIAVPTSTRPAHLPTLTPTPPPNAVAQEPSQQPEVVASEPTATPLPTPTLEPTGIAIPIPTAPLPTTAPSAAPAPPSQNQPEPPPPPPADDSESTSRPETPGWSFVGIQTSMAEDEAHVVGEIINNTGSSQQAIEISGIFYDAKGQVIQEGIDTLSYVPVEIIPVGAHVPFILDVTSDRPVYRLDLLARSNSAEETPRQDFQFANVSQRQASDGLYCLDGQVQNPGASLQDYLVVLATVYNSQGSLVTFGEYAPSSPEIIESGQTSPFEMCLDPLGEQVTHYQLNALGY